MGFLGDLVQFFSANLWGSGGVVNRMWEHIQITAIVMVGAVILTVPIAMWLAHYRRGRFLAVTAVNIGRAVPSFGIIALALPITIAIARNVPFIESGLGFWPAFIALFALALPPVFTNAYIGVEDVDQGLVEAARGMGMTERGILWHVELPVALPLILAGIRTATVQVAATATLAALVAWGGLGRFIIDGFARQDRVMLVAGALLVALLAIAIEVGASLAERFLVAPGVRRERVAAGAMPR